MNDTPLAEKVVAIDRALRRANVAHAFGGALALAYYAEPRATIDIDLNVFVPAERFDLVAGALESLGVAVELDRDLLQRDGQCRLWWDRTPLDLFFSYDPLHEAMAKAVRRVPFGDEQLPVLSPEHLAVCKAMFDRPKDWLDLEQMLVTDEPIDLEEIRGWLAAIAGEQDHRLARLDELTSRA